MALTATAVVCACSAQVVHAGGPALAAPANLAPAALPAAVPSGDLPGWRQTFKDDFTQDVAVGDFPDAVSTKWRAYPSPWRDTSGNGTYSPEKVVSIDNGVLDMHLRMVGGQAMVAALLPQVPGTGLYGRYAVRFRGDPLPGYKMAWMLWPNSGTGKANGEIDFPERDLNSLNTMGFVHYTNSQFAGDQDWARAPMDITEWHTTVIEWSPGKVVFYLDGVEIGRTISSRVPDSPMHWVLQTESSLRHLPLQSTNGHLQIDWVAAWAYDPASKAGTTDNADPKVSVGSLTDGQTVSAAVPVTATATDASGIREVKWYVDGEEIAWDGDAPWTDRWNTAASGDGAHRVWVKALDGAGNWGTSESIVVNVNN